MSDTSKSVSGSGQVSEHVLACRGLTCATLCGPVGDWTPAGSRVRTGSLIWAPRLPPGLVEARSEHAEFAQTLKLAINGEGIRSVSHPRELRVDGSTVAMLGRRQGIAEPADLRNRVLVMREDRGV